MLTNNSENISNSLNKDKKDLISACHAVFTSAQGNNMLELLKKQYLMQPVRDPNKSDAHACIREGENNLIRFFMQSIELHNQLARLSVQENSK